MLEAWFDARSGICCFWWRRNIQKGKTPLAAKVQKMVRMNPGQEVFELCGSGLAAVQRKIQRHRSHRYSITGSPDPAPEASFAEGFVTIAGGSGPLQGMFDATADRV